MPGTRELPIPSVRSSEDDGREASGGIGGTLNGGLESRLPAADWLGGTESGADSGSEMVSEGAVRRGTTFRLVSGSTVLLEAEGSADGSSGGMGVAGSSHASPGGGPSGVTSVKRAVRPA